MTNYYCRRLDVWEACGDLYNALEKHGNKFKHPIYRALCKHAGTIIENKGDKFVCEMDLKKTFMI